MEYINTSEDKLHEECGVFGIFGSPDASTLTALGLHAYNIVVKKVQELFHLMEKSFTALEGQDLLGITLINKR